MKIALLFAFLIIDLTLLAGPEQIPPDLPLSADPPCQASWLAGANILQPFGHSEFNDLVNLGHRPARLKAELGFNTIVILPPDSHNATTAAVDHYSDAQFRRALDVYRGAGYRIILYTSLEGCGAAPEFQSGQLAREHPGWEQRDPSGNPVLVYGQPWLCPSTGAREYTLARALRMARDYQPDGILLDNNEFFFAAGGWTCHCAACNRGFRQYVRQRFGGAETKSLFGVAPDQLEIPTAEGPLFSLWLEWRNRVWAGINESFRARLRQINPNIIIFGNTQYLYDNADLGTDMQYVHEDIVVSESCNLSSRRMSEKMLLGQAVAEGRPLWNYIGTFVNSGDYTGLKPAEVVSPLIAATLAHNARPWIVDGFDEGQTNANSRHAMAGLLGWHAAHPELFDNPPWAPVGVVFSLNSRNVLHRHLIPPHLAAFLQNGVPVAGLRDDKLSSQVLNPFKVITLETAGCLDQSAALALARWVRHGGVLIAAADAGCYDELGRKRVRSVLWQALGLAAAPAAETRVGRGNVMAPSPDSFAEEAVNQTRSYAFRFAQGAGLETVPYVGHHSLTVQIVRHKAPVQPVTVRLPGAFKPAVATAQWLTPGSGEAAALPLADGSDGCAFTLTNPPVYSIVRIPLR